MFRTPSGYAGADIAAYKQPGSNGLAFDGRGRLTINEHGNRRVTRLEADGQTTVLADRFEGRRLNSPNDLVYRSDGALFFTDPPFGLPKVFDDRAQGAVVQRRLRAASTASCGWSSKELTGPNGIAFSPDERYLYVGNWDERRKVVMRYEIARDGSASNGRVFFDMTTASGEDAIDGIKVDVQRQPVRLRTGWPVGDHARRRAPWHDRRAASHPQHGLGRRRWPDAVPLCARSALHDAPEHSRRRDGEAALMTTGSGARRGPLFYGDTRQRTRASNQTGRTGQVAEPV